MTDLLSKFHNSYGSHFRNTLLLSFPVIIGQLGNVLMGVADTLMIGELGYGPISAAALANGIYFIIIVLGMGITFVISPLVAEADASGNEQGISRYLHNSLWVGLISSLLLGTLIYYFADILPFLDQPEEDVRLAQPYLRILSISTFPMILFLVGKQFVDGLSMTRPAMVITLIGLAVNVLGNWLWIYGNWGFPALGLDGAGYSTLASRGIMLLLIVAYILFNKKVRRYVRPVEGKWVNIPSMMKIFRLGIPSGFQFFFEVGAFAGASIMIGWIGIADRAAHQIVLNLASITYMVTTGIASGSAIRVGNALGRNDIEEVRKSGMAGVYLGGIFMLAMAGVFFGGRNLLPALYVEDQEVLKIASVLMVYSGLFQLFDGIQAVAIGILRGIQDVKIPTYITFVAYWVITLPTVYLLSFTFSFGVSGVWISFIVGLGVAAVALTYRFWILTSTEKKGLIVQQKS